MVESVVRAGAPHVSDAEVTWSGMLHHGSDEPAGLTYRFTTGTPPPAGAVRPFLLSFLPVAMWLGDPLVVEGEIVNRSPNDISVPAIRISLRSPAGAEVYSWLVEPTAAGIGPGRSLGFRSAVASPPEDASQVTLRLAQRESRTIGMR